MKIRAPLASLQTAPFLFSPFPRSSRAARASVTWWLSVLWGRRVGCRPPSPPRRHRDTFSRTKASPRSPRTRSKWGFTTTEEKALSAPSPPFTPLRKVGHISAARVQHRSSGDGCGACGIDGDGCAGAGAAPRWSSPLTACCLGSDNLFILNTESYSGRVLVLVSLLRDRPTVPSLEIQSSVVER